MISWERTFEVALFHRLALAEDAYKKLRLVWNSTMSRTRKLKVFESKFVPILLYGRDALTFSQKQLYRVDSQYMRFLRRVMGRKASHYSRIPSAEVHKQANYPTLPATTLQYGQCKTLTNIFSLPRTIPVNGVVFGSAYKDRILLQGRRRGKPHPADSSRGAEFFFRAGAKERIRRALAAIAKYPPLSKQHDRNPNPP